MASNFQHFHRKRIAMMQFRQGDVLLIRVRSIPKSAQRQAVTDHIILAHGEVTGHAHTIDARHAIASLDEGGVMFLTVEELTEVRHNEHSPLTLEPGSYRVVRQREYSPAAIRNVAD